MMKTENRSRKPSLGGEGQGVPFSGFRYVKGLVFHKLRYV